MNGKTARFLRSFLWWAGITASSEHRARKRAWKAMGHRQRGRTRRAIEHHMRRQPTPLAKYDGFTPKA